MNVDKSKFKDVVELEPHIAVGLLKRSEAVISKNNVRIQSKYVDALTDVSLGKSIEAYGIANLILCNSQGEIVCGSRRLRAMKDKEWIPVLIRDDLDDSQQIEISLHENWARTDLGVEDEISGLKKYLKEYPNLTMPEVAKNLRMPLTYVTDRMQIDKNILPLLNGEPIVKTRGLSASREKKAFTLAKASILARDWISKEAREECIRKIQKEGMGKDELQREIGKWKVVQTIIEQEEKPEIKKKLEEEYSTKSVFEVDPKDVLERKRNLEGLSPNLEKVSLPIESFEKVSLKAGVNVPPEINREIVKFFLDGNGRFVKYSIIIEGELPLLEIKKLKTKNP
jgi:ParB-like chromosome segregation protein Spo0J